MKPAKSQWVEAAELRRKAERKLREDLISMQLPISEVESRHMLHELQVHQVELEMQNTELRRARDEAEMALEMYADLYDFAPVGYMTLDREGRISAANLTLATLLGIERSRLIGQRFGALICDETAHDCITFVGRVFASKARETCDVTLSSAENYPRVLRIEAVASVSGEECRAAVIDISERRKQEGKLERLHTELLAKAAELESANIDLEAFNYSVSHDLRGPLTTIAGYSGIVEELFGKKRYEECHSYIREIQEGTMRMNKLIDTLLEFSRVKSSELQIEKVDLTKLAEETALELKSSVPERRVTFRIAKGIMADASKNLMQMVLKNLMSNAWKYSGKREEAVIEFDVMDVDGKATYFIRDNGIGFDMEHAEKLFVPFQRLVGKEIPGHGIGLATVDRIVRRHGGLVWAESKPDEGATFFFTLGTSGVTGSPSRQRAAFAATS